MLSLLTLAARTRAEESAPTAPSSRAPIGLTLTVDLGGGGTVGGGSTGLFEGELTAGYELPYGFRPELSLLLGMSPGSYTGLRPGLHYALADLPVYLRADLDWAYPHGVGKLRWLLIGAGAELRFTGLFGIFGEADTGLPLTDGAGVPLELRAGVSLRF